jgi:HD-like signal output (HDOD) protein
VDRAIDRDLLRDICRRGAPLLPSSSTRLALELARDESLNDDVLVEHLESDPRLRYGLLIGANASLFEVKRSTKTVRQALGQLGRNRCQSVLWLLALSDFLRVSGQMPERARLRLWKHSLLTAVVAHRLLSAARIDHAPEGLSAGMAHDLGHLLLASPAARLGIVWHEEHEQLAERGNWPPPELDHCRLGAALLELWDAPAALVSAARDHHQPALAPEGVRPIVSGVRLADILAEYIERERTDRALFLESSERWTELASMGPWACVPGLHQTAVELLPEALLTAEHLANLLGS